ncbi:hypothetical protein C2S52_001326 [Perilla frutescens var. hirtella]|nr:hypothetical protein C2S52_001326 [Perilla frutescens var. hirtella]
MMPGDGNNKKTNKSPAAPNTPSDASSSDQWDAQFHYKAMSQYFERRSQLLEDKLEDSLAKVMAQLELINARPPLPPAVQGQPVQNETAPRHMEVPTDETYVYAEPARAEARANARAQQPVQRRQPPVQKVYHDYRDAEDNYGDFAEESEAGFEPYQRRDRPRQPYRRAARAYPPFQPRRADPDSLLNNIKISIPAFEGLHDPDLYLDWERKVNKIFECYDFPEVKKVQLASMKFTGNAASWWENIQNRRHRDRYPPIDSWQEMKDVMRGRFIPVNYERELERRLSQICQGTRSIEEYHKELETAMNRVGKEETLIATINWYIEGMHPDIACEFELKDFTSIEAMIHYASIVERQLKEGRRCSSHSVPARTPWVRTPQPTRRPEHSSSVSNQNNQSRLVQSNQPQDSTPGRAHDVQCHKCRGWGHFQAQCPNRRVLFLSEQNELESASEEELNEVKIAGDDPQSRDGLLVDKIDDEKPDPAHVSLVLIRALSLIREEDQNDQRENIFYARCSIRDNICSLIIDSGSVVNAISQYAVGKLNLVPQKHPKPYRLQWLTDRGEIRVGYQVSVTFSIGHFVDIVLCDVIPMEASHILLGRPWQFDRKAFMTGLPTHIRWPVDGRPQDLQGDGVSFEGGHQGCPFGHFVALLCQ